MLQELKAGQEPRRSHLAAGEQHGAGSPQAQRVMISRQGNIEAKKEMAKRIAKLDESKDK